MIELIVMILMVIQSNCWGFRHRSWYQMVSFDLHWHGKGLQWSDFLRLVAHFQTFAQQFHNVRVKKEQQTTSNEN